MVETAIEWLHEAWWHISVSCAVSFNIPSDVHSYLFCAIASSEEKEMYVSCAFRTIMLLELNQASAGTGDQSHHIKESQEPRYVCIDDLLVAVYMVRYM